MVAEASFSDCMHRSRHRPITNTKLCHVRLEGDTDGSTDNVPCHIKYSMCVIANNFHCECEGTQ